SAWERLSFEEQKLFERFADCVYGELINNNTESVDVFAAKNHLTVYLPGYHVREKLLRRDELINKYKEVLGAEYVDFFLESVSRFNNKYTVR
ncbi:MAG: hypothetical protein MJ078_04670, partial [Clostridia bacterium]|nr:hypothetical protein [Clostridia bacterium]